MHTYNAIVRLGAKLDNEVAKKNLTTPEILLLKKIHGDDGVVKIEESGYWEDHFGKRTLKDDLGEEYEEEREYDDDAEKNRLAYVYGDAILKDEDEGNGRNAIDRMFGEFAALPLELKEFKAARREKATAKVAEKTVPSKKGNLDKVA